jgi:hypothetical protein
LRVLVIAPSSQRSEPPSDPERFNERIGEELEAEWSEEFWGKLFWEQIL